MADFRFRIPDSSMASQATAEKYVAPPPSFPISLRALDSVSRRATHRSPFCPFRSFRPSFAPRCPSPKTSTPSANAFTPPATAAGVIPPPSNSSPSRRPSPSRPFARLIGSGKRRFVAAPRSRRLRLRRRRQCRAESRVHTAQRGNGGLTIVHLSILIEITVYGMMMITWSDTKQK